MKQQSLKIFSKEETGPYELPKGWRWVKLGDKDLFHIETGSTPKTDVKEYWQNGNIKWITPKDLGKLTNKFIFDTERKITQDGLNSCSTTIIPKGSIIISTRAPIGHIAICGDEMCFNQGCKGIVIKNKNQVLNDFLYYVLLTKVKEMDALGSGATFKEISRKKLASIQIPLPPLPEQKRIVARIEALFSKIDEIKRLRKEANDLAKTLLPSALHEVFSKADEKGWKWVRLGEILDLSNGKSITKKEMKEDGAYLVYGSNGVIGKANKYLINKDTIVIGRVGACGVVNIAKAPAWISDNAMYVSKLSDDIDILFLYYALTHLDLSRLAKIVAQPSISQEPIKEQKIPIPFKNRQPALDEQKRIVSYLDQISEKQKTLLKIYADIDNQITQLKQSILTKAFRGQLGKQNFNNDL